MACTLSESRGTKAEESQFLYHVSLRKYQIHRCSGSIIDATTILCAAHTVLASNLAPVLKVLVGTHKLNPEYYEYHYYAKEYDVKSIIIHEEFDFMRLKNNIAIIKLEEPIEFNANVQPVKLRQTPIGDDEDCILSGWGKYSIQGPNSDELLFIKLKTLDARQYRQLRNLTPVEPSNLFAITRRGNGDSIADLGGPLVDSNGELIGIVSSVKTHDPTRPDVFIRVSSFLDWIEKNR